MGVELPTTGGFVCCRCGIAYGQKKGFFQVNYGALYKGSGYLPYCRTCVEKLFAEYLKQSGDLRMAVRQVCRKLDLYWNDTIFDYVTAKNSDRALIVSYITRSNTANYIGKCYDDTLKSEGTLWRFGKIEQPKITELPSIEEEPAEPAEDDLSSIPEEIIEFWGSGYNAAMYDELEQRRLYWMKRFPDGTELDIGTEALLRQICNLEVDINKGRASGKPVDKEVGLLNSLIGSLGLKPSQKKDDGDTSAEKTPMGVWIQRFESQRPIPDVDPELEDVDGIKKYLSVWFLGHLCHMLNIKNTYSKLYEDEMDKLRVEKPEYADEEEETMFNDIFANSDGGDDG